MRIVTMYESNDGIHWKTQEEAEKRDAVLATIEKAMAPLGRRPKFDGRLPFKHEAEDFQAAKAAILALAKEEFAWFGENPAVFDPDQVDPRYGFVGRLILGTPNSPLREAWCRLSCFTPEGQEYSHPSYAFPV